MTDAPTVSRPAPRLDSIVIGLLALAAYAAVRQEVFYSVDARLQILAAQRGDLFYTTHMLCTPLLWLAHRALSPFGIEWFAIASWASAGGMALGVALLHRATVRLGLSRGRSALAAALIATTPTVMFFASVAELHGPFFPAVGVAAMVFAGLLNHPTTRRACWLGVAVGASYLLHATGALMVGVFALLYGALTPHAQSRWGRVRAAAWCGILCGVVAATVALGSAVLLRLFVDVPGARALRFLLSRPEGLMRLAQTPLVVAREWLLWCAPLAVLCFASVRSMRWRPLLTALLLAIAGYSVVTAWLLHERVERGAYNLPLLWPAAVLAAATLRVRVLWISALLGALASLVPIASHHTPEPGRRFAAELRTVAPQPELAVLLGTDDELNACLIHAPQAEAVALPAFCLLPEDDEPRVQAWLQGWEAWIAMRHRQGKAVVITAGALRFLQEGYPDMPFAVPPGPGRRLLAALRDAFAWRPVTDTGLHRLLPR